MPVATRFAVRASHADLAAAAHAEDVISFASEAKETDWLHRNDLPTPSSVRGLLSADRIHLDP